MLWVGNPIAKDTIYSPPFTGGAWGWVFYYSASFPAPIPNPPSLLGVRQSVRMVRLCKRLIRLGRCR